MKIDIKEIARQAGVSIATVSRALNGNGPVKEQTRKKILDIAKQHNYTPNPIARGLSRKKTDTIGVILPELVDEFFMDLIHGIDEEAYRSNRYILLSSSHSQRNIVQTSLEFMTSGRVDGVILMAPQMQQSLTDLVSGSKKPIIMLNCGKEINRMVSFSINNYRGAFTVTQHLVEHGYKKIAIIQGPKGNCDAEERYRGYRAALGEFGLPVDSKFIVQGNFTIQSGYYAFNRLMTQDEKPQAIFAANDMMAIGVFEAAKRMSIKIPDDIAVVGFDDITLSKYLAPRLTTIHVPIQELGSKAVRYLIKMINCEVDPKEPYHEELSTGLMIGGSCGCQVPPLQNLI